MRIEDVLQLDYGTLFAGRIEGDEVPFPFLGGGRAACELTVDGDAATFVIDSEITRVSPVSVEAAHAIAERRQRGHRDLLAKSRIDLTREQARTRERLLRGTVLPRDPMWTPVRVPLLV
jgi:hypothetical protein